MGAFEMLKNDIEAKLCDPVILKIGADFIIFSIGGMFLLIGIKSVAKDISSIKEE